MLSLTKAFEARNERIRNDEKGFTLIELLVVVIIIGILAAIAIPVFLGQQDKARDGTTRSDLANAKVFYVSNLVDDPSGDAGTTGFTESPGSSVIGGGAITAGDGTPFCLDATSEAGNPFNITDTTGVEPGGC